MQHYTFFQCKEMKDNSLNYVTRLLYYVLFPLNEILDLSPCTLYFIGRLATIMIKIDLRCLKNKKKSIPRENVSTFTKLHFRNQNPFKVHDCIFEVN